jgi:hypothetical protein
MPIGVAETVAVVRLTWEAFLQLAGFANGRLRSRTVERELDRAWRELLKGDAADMSVVEAALANARAAGPLSANGARLAAAKAKAEAPVRKPAPKRRARTDESVNGRTSTSHSRNRGKRGGA